VFWQGYDRYNAHPTWPSEAGQRQAAEMAHQCGCDFLWLDAAWFQGNFPDGAGNWFCKPKEFPNGLKPVSDACHKLGLKFMVWFEPERVAPGTQIAKEHPEFVFGGSGGGLFKLGDPAARRWLTDLLLKRIGEYGMDWYRNDFNIDPLPFWRQNDAPDRQGMTEIRYVEGHYAMWDEMLARYPGLLIDNCASGGRRIDLETIQRSLPLWRSDTGCLMAHGDWHQAQAMGMNYYLPLNEICAWTPDAYEMRSTSGAGAIVQFGFLDKGYSPDAARRAVAEVKENQKYFYGDYYPLSGCSPEPDQFAAYQVHRADLGAGLVLAFRRAKCNVRGISVRLGGLRPEANYEVDFIDEQRQKTSKTMSGRVLSTDLQLMIPERGASLLVRYRQQ
jgi:alpha-galactosidase